MPHGIIQPGYYWKLFFDVQTAEGKIITLCIFQNGNEALIEAETE